MGLYDSTWLYLDQYGLLVGEADFKLGNGKQIAYFANGKKKRVTPFRNNVIDGTVEFYNPEGTLVKEQIYENGIFIEEREK
jgi:antitoxin component YwqK of YwqJK toxin-antitoxin module